jgi:hypothetical protein
MTQSTPKHHIINSPFGLKTPLPVPMTILTPVLQEKKPPTESNNVLKAITPMETKLQGQILPDVAPILTPKSGTNQSTDQEQKSIIINPKIISIPESPTPLLTEETTPVIPENSTKTTSTAVPITERPASQMTGSIKKTSLPSKLALVAPKVTIQGNSTLKKSSNNLSIPNSTITNSPQKKLSSTQPSPKSAQKVQISGSIRKSTQLNSTLEKSGISSSLTLEARVKSLEDIVTKLMIERDMNESRIAALEKALKTKK